MIEQENSEKIAEALSDIGWRLNNLYYIRDTSGKKIKFKPNWAQADFLKNLHYYNVVLKARQLGFSTAILIYMFDACLFNSNHKAGIIDAGIDEAKKKLGVIKFAYDNMPDWLKEYREMPVRAAENVEFDNGSVISVGTSHRGDTLQKLHISEYGKIAARYPEKAREIKTGALNTVHSGQQIFIESTAEGNQGEFYDIVQYARNLEREKKQLSPLQPKFHFYPWYKNESYKLPEAVDTVSIDNKLNEYFDKLGIKLSPEQKAWYAVKAQTMGEDMKREFPSTPDESFEQSLEGAYYNKEMALVRERGQITNVPHNPHNPVYTFWDLGKGRGLMAIWFMQHINNEMRFIDYHASHNEGWDFYAKLLSSKPYVYKEHIFPHDANTAIVGRGIQTAKKIAEGLGIVPIRVVPRTNSVADDIKNFCKPVIPRCFFDEKACKDGIWALDNYRKEWNERLVMWSNKPRDDEAAHGADAFRTFAVGYVENNDYLNQNYMYEKTHEVADYDYDLLSY